MKLLTALVLLVSIQVSAGQLPVRVSEFFSGVVETNFRVNFDEFVKGGVSIQPNRVIELALRLRFYCPPNAFCIQAINPIEKIRFKIKKIKKVEGLCGYTNITGIMRTKKSVEVIKIRDNSETLITCPTLRGIAPVYVKYTQYKKSEDGKTRIRKGEFRGKSFVTKYLYTTRN